MSFDAVFRFINLVAANSSLSAELAAIDASRVEASAVAAFACDRGFDFTEEEYRFLQPYALVLAPQTTPDQVGARPDIALKSPLRDAHDVRATLLGNSHASVIRLAANAQGFPLKVHSFLIGPQPYVNSEVPSELSAFHPVIAQSIATGPVFSAIGRSMHERLFLMQHPRRFDFILPTRRDLPTREDDEIIPFGAMLDTCARALELDLMLIALAQKTATGPFFHILVQPPLEEDALALDMTPFSRASVPVFDVSPAALRLKVYLVTCSITQAWCAERQIPILPPPDKAVNERGYLKPEFALNTTHGNQAYGELVLEQIRKCL